MTLNGMRTKKMRVNSLRNLWDIYKPPNQKIVPTNNALIIATEKNARMPTKSDEQQFYSIKNNTALQTAVIALRNKKRVTSAKSIAEQRKLSKTRRHLHSKYFSCVTAKDLKNIRDTSKLPQSFDSSIRHYVYFDRFDEFAMLARTFRPLMSIDRRYFIEVFKTTKIRDIIDPLPWSQITGPLEKTEENEGTPGWKRFIRPRGTAETQILEVYFCEEGNPSLVLEIHKGTSIRDIKKVWPKVISAQDIIIGMNRYRNKKNHERNLEALRLKEKGKKSADIAGDINDIRDAGGGERFKKNPFDSSSAVRVSLHRLRHVRASR